MVYQTLTDVNVTTMSGLFAYVSGEAPYFFPLVLVFLFLIVTMSVFYGQKRTNGEANFFGCLAIAGYFTFVVAVFMSLIPNVINLFTLVVCLVISIVCTFLYLISNQSD